MPQKAWTDEQRKWVQQTTWVAVVVHDPQMCFRLPKLIFVAGAALTYLAATHHPIPTGWWDKHPKPTAGRLRRA